MSYLSGLDLAGRATMAEPKKRGWIKKAVKPENKGKFRAKAERAGMSTSAYAAKEAHAPGALGKEARFAQNVMGLHKKSRMSKLYDHRKES